MTPTPPTDHACIDVCNRLLRGELSAVATYNQVIDQFSDEPEVSLLTRMRDEHAASVSRLYRSVKNMGGEPDLDTGAWGVFTTALQATANLLGDHSAIAMILQGEKHGEKEYTEALADDNVSPPSKEMIRDLLLPQTKRHIAALEQLAA